MIVSVVLHKRTAMPAGLGLIASVGLAATEVATYWDDSWHTDRGRDDFAIPPHLLLYGGVLLAALAVAAWAVSAWRAAGWGASGIRRTLQDPAMRLAGIGGATTLASAPLDNWWHSAFGRDAVLWSPPHLAAVAGILALVVGLSAGLRTTVGRGAQTARLFAGAGIIGALQVLVLEYDSDVPQFSTFWYLPVATLALCTAYALLDDLLPGRWMPAEAAAVYTLLRAGTVVLLAALGFSLTAIPPVFLLLLALGFLAHLPMAIRLALLGAVSPLVWWPMLQLQSDVAATVPLRELPAAVALGLLGGLLVALVHGDLRRGPVMTAGIRAAVVFGVLALTITAVPEKASAHDPGQGEFVQDVNLSVARNSTSADLTLSLRDGCEGLEPVRVVGTRAGVVRSGVLRMTPEGGSGCTIRGKVAGLTPGRWFVYAELATTGGKSLEAWLPVSENETVTESRVLYAPPPDSNVARSQVLVGAGLLAVILAIIVSCLRLARRASRPIDY